MNDSRGSQMIWAAVLIIGGVLLLVFNYGLLQAYEPLAQWGFALFFVAAMIGFLALAAYGASLLQVGLVPAWAAWATILFSLALLIQLLIMGDTLPAFHYLPPVLIGVLLVLRG